MVRILLLSILVVSLIVIIGLVFLIAFGFFASDVKLEHSEPAAEVEQVDFEAEVLGMNCNPEIDKDGDNVPDSLDVEGSIDWSNCMLAGANLSNLELSYANLSGSVLYGANLYNTNLSGANLAGADLIGKNLVLLDPLLSSSSLELMSKSGFADMGIPGQLIFSHMFGEFGRDQEQFYKPAGIAVDEEGKVHVADFYNDRIQIFDQNGNFDSKIEIEGRPHGIEVFNNKSYIVKWYNGNQIITESDLIMPHVEVRDKFGKQILTIPGPLKPVDIAIDEIGNIYVSDYLTGTIHIFDQNGNVKKIITIPDDNVELLINEKCFEHEICSMHAKLTGITLDNENNILVTDFLNHRVIKLDSSGNILFEFKVPPEEGGNFSRPTNVEINDLTGDVFVTDNSDRVLVFNSSGNFLYSFGESGRGLGQFSAPHGITIDDFGYIYVAEYLNHRIQIFYPVDSFQISPNIAEQEASRDLTGTILKGADLSGKDLTGTILTGIDLSDYDLTGTILTGADLTGTILRGANLTDANLTGVDLSGMDLTGTILRGVDLSNRGLTGTILTGADLTDANLTGVDLSGMDLTGTALTGVDLSGMDLTGTILTGVDLSGMDLTGTALTEANLTDANLTGVDLSGMDLTATKFNNANLEGVNLQNTDLSFAEFVQVDFTKIKNKSLAGADLSGASFAYSNLSGVDLSGGILELTNFWNADLTDQDFTVLDVISVGLAFADANLSNSNFESVDLEPKEMFTQVFKNKAYLMKEKENKDIVKDLFGESTLIIIMSKEVQGNDLVVSYIFINSFRDANLENVNFKNANLRIASFYSANLTNADLSGADLSGAVLNDADLSNANLEGANLERTYVKCKNHPICESN